MTATLCFHLLLPGWLCHQGERAPTRAPSLLYTHAFSFPSQYYLSSWPCSCSCSKSVLLSPRGTEQGTDMTIPEVAFQHFITQNCFHQLPPKTREKLMCVPGCVTESRGELQSGASIVPYHRHSSYWS